MSGANRRTRVAFDGVGEISLERKAVLARSWAGDSLYMQMVTVRYEALRGFELFELVSLLFFAGEASVGVCGTDLLGFAC